MNKKYAFWVFVLALVLIIGGLFFYKIKQNKEKVPAPVPLELIESFDNGNFDRAIEVVNETFKSNPKDVTSLLSLSSIYSQKGSLEFKEKENGQIAADYAIQALKINPNNSLAYIALGYAKEIMSDFKGSMEAYTKAISLNPDSAGAYVRRGHTYDLMGDLKNAEADYVKANDLDSDNVDVLMNLGRLYIRKGKVKEAESKFISATLATSNIRIKADAYYDLSLVSDPIMHK